MKRYQKLLWYRFEAANAHGTIGDRSSIFSSGFRGPQ
jgi:hypothetical protein